MPSKIPLLVLNVENAQLIYALSRVGVQAIRANIDLISAKYTEKQIETLTNLIMEGEKLCTFLKELHPDINCPFTFGGLLREQNNTGEKGTK